MNKRDKKNILMISGDTLSIQNSDGTFETTLNEIKDHFNRIDIYCPGVICAGGQHRKFSNIYFYGSKNKFEKLLPILKLFKILGQRNTDVIISHDYGLMRNGISGFFASCFFKIPIVHEIFHIEGYPKHVSAKELFFKFWGIFVIRFLYRFSDLLRVPNETDLKPLLERVNFPMDKVKVVRCIYLDFDIFRPKKIDKKFDLIYCGRLVQNKGIFTLLDSVRKMPDLSLVLKGRGPLIDEIRQYLEDNNLTDRVSINQEILDLNELSNLYNSARVLICASTTEGGPRVTFEAMACGVPVISTRVGLVPEIITESSKNGILFDGSEGELIECVKNLLGDQDLYEEIQKNSIESVKILEKSHVLEGYCHVINGL